MKAAMVSDKKSQWWKSPMQQARKIFWFIYAAGLFGLCPKQPTNKFPLGQGRTKAPVLCFAQRKTIFSRPDPAAATPNTSAATQQ
jgi:hypothetical protein